MASITGGLLTSQVSHIIKPPALKFFFSLSWNTFGKKKAKGAQSNKGKKVTETCAFGIAVCSISFKAKLLKKY
jgi:hypothetical protein